MESKSVLAKAIYDNVAETRDELEFSRGDIVTVIEQNTAGLEGWWLCAFQGRQGIAPGNRLRILPGMYSGRFGKHDEDTYDVPPTHAWLTAGRKPVAPDDDEDEEYDVPRRQPQINHNNNNLGSLDSPTEVYDIPRASAWQQTPEEVYDIPPIRSHAADEEQEVYNVPSNLIAIPDPREIYDVPPLVSRGPQQSPARPEQEEVYDVPPRKTEHSFPNEMITVQDPEELYDVPPASREQRHFPRQESAESDVVYDIPQSAKPFSERRQISSGLNSLRRMKREIKEVTRTPDIQPAIMEPTNSDYVYDVPPQVTRDHSQTMPQCSADDVVDGLLRRLSVSSAPNDTNLRSNRMSTASRDSYSSYIDDNPTQYSELKVGLDEALEQLITLKQTLEDSVSNLLTLVKENWRKAENIAGKTHDVQKSFLEVLVAVNQFLNFARGATANAFAVQRNDEERAPKQVQTGLRKLIVPLEEDLEMLKRALGELESSSWDISKLAVDNNNEDGTILDEVDSFVMTSRAVSDDATQMAIYIHTHAQYIFKKSTNVLNVPISQRRSASSDCITRPLQEIQALQARPLPAVPQTRAVTIQPTAQAMAVDQEGWLEDYDYVALPDKEELDESKKEAGGIQNPITGLNKRKTQLLALEKELTQPVRNEVFTLSPQDKESLRNLELDVPDLIQSLSHAIDRFINAVDSGKPPHSFVALGKHVILSAHKLVFVGDCVHRNLTHAAAKVAIKDQCSSMCAALKRTVISTKLAALQWPSVVAVQDMVDKMFEIATCAHQIRLTLSNIMSTS